MLKFLEQRVLFSIARGFFWLLVIATIAAASLAGHSLWTQYENTKTKIVTQSEVVASLKADSLKPAASLPEDSSDPAVEPKKEDVENGLTIPSIVNIAASYPSTRNVLDTWLTGLSPGDRQPFLDGLAASVSDIKLGPDGSRVGEQNGQKIAERMNKFRDLQIAAFQSRDRAQGVLQGQYLYIAVGVASVVAIIALLSLVLVLLAIERNTRTAPIRSA